MNWFTFHRAYQICIKTNKTSCLLQWTLLITPRAGTTTVFFCRLSIIYNPRISFINFDQQQVRLLDSCSGSENKIFLSLTVDHLGAGDSGILRQLLFSIIIFLIQWISPSYFLWKSGFCSIQELFLSKLWTLRLNFRCYYFIPLFTESFTVTAMPKKSPFQWVNHTSAQRVVSFMYFQVICWKRANRITGIAQSSLNEAVSALNFS